MKNEKGFLLAESLIVSTFVLTILIILFIQFSNLTNNYKNSYSHNNVESIYDLSSVATYLTTNQYDLSEYLTVEKPYVLVYKDDSCNLEIGLADSFCDTLMNEMGAKTIIYTSSDVKAIQYYVNNNEDRNISQKFREFISKIDAKPIQNKGRLFAEFSNGTFSTIAFDSKSVNDSSSSLECIPENVVTSGSGMYFDDIEDGKCIFKGANPNNYIRFNDELWRIISLESDGTIKIIRSETESNNAFDNTGERDQNSNGSGGTYCANGTSGCNAWSKNDNFTNGSIAGNVLKDASLNTYLNNNYLNKITTNKANIISHAWNVGPITANNDNINNQVNDEKAIQWNGKIGLITASEFIRANSNTNQCGTLSLNNNNSNTCVNTNWIYNTVPETGYMWTITPNINNNNQVFSIDNTQNQGVVTYNIASNSQNAYVTPVLYLSDSTVITGGTGTREDPYLIDIESIKIELKEPTFTEEGINPKTITIHFQEECKDTLTCTYQVNGGSPVTVKDTEAKVDFTESGSILATVSDGESMLSNSYDVDIEELDDSITLEISTSATSHSINIVANANSNFDITKYEYSNDGGQTWQNGGTKNTYTFENLTQGKTYNIMVRVTNEKDVQATESRQVTTTSFTVPTFKEEGIYPKTVIITYPEGCGTTLTCSYQKDNEPAVEVKTNSKKVTFDYHGSIVATVTDGTNTLSSSYNVRITLRAVDLSYDNTKTGMNCVDAQCALDEIKKLIDKEGN